MERNGGEREKKEKWEGYMKGGKKTWRESLGFLLRIRIKFISYFCKAMAKIPGENNVM